MQSISQHLRRRTATAGADPLVTYYDLGTGERTELSAVTVTNWVAKTCHLLSDDHGLDLGDVVLLDLARTHPGHWVTSCLELACWSLGLVVAVEDGGVAAAGVGAAGDDVRLVVTGPLYDTATDRAAAAGAELVACSLHPLGLPFAEQLPAGVADYSLEVRAQPDQFSAGAVPDDQPAWRSPEATLTQSELASVTGAAGRRLLRPGSPWGTARDGILAALVGGGSVVVVVGDDEPALARIRATENVDDEVGQVG